MPAISNEKKQYLLSLTPESLTFDVLVDLFAKIKSKGEKLAHSEPVLKPTDTFEISPSEYSLVKKKHVTTVGKFIYNKYVIEGSGVQEACGYVDWELTDSGNSKLEKILSSALLDDIITVSQFASYIDRRDTMGQQLHAVICASFTPGILKTPPEVTKRREELFTQHKEELDAGDVACAVKIEKELLDIAKEKLKDDPAMDLYTSEARGSFGNNYKNNHVMKGAIYNSITGEYNIVKSGLMEGFDKKDIPSFGNAVIAGSYPTAIGTADAGYMSKQLIAVLQTEVLDEKDSDCGTKKTIDITITKDNCYDYVYRYIIEGNGFVELTNENISSYIGKTVHMRSPQMCIGKKLCNKCMGNLFYRLGIDNVGLTSTAVSSKLLKLKLKAKHDGTAKITILDPDGLLMDS